MISYRGFSAPDIGIAHDTKTQGVQYFTQRNMETMINAGQLFRPGGCESFEEWIERGAYYNWVWPRDGGDLSTRFHVNVAFKAETLNPNADPLHVWPTLGRSSCSEDGHAISRREVSCRAPPWPVSSYSSMTLTSSSLT